MKRQVEQKREGHKAKDNPVFPQSSAAAEPLSKEKVNFTKNKNAANQRNKKRK
jgi:hypothetical protein